MALTMEQMEALRGSPVISSEGEEIGEVDQVYYDEESRMPRWVELKAGLLGMRRAVVPLAQAEVRDVKLHVPYTKQQVQDAPEPELVEALSPSSEREMDRHYGIEARPQPTANGDPDAVSFVRVMRVYVWPQ